jgi:glutamate formiminotransferase/glutamate formiminotransferase/formiminotetrahydrofolate cyclodeaminase
VGPGSPLIAVPNASEGRERASIDALAAAFGRRARVLDVHSDPDHGRSVYTIAASQGELAAALLDGAREAIGRIDLRVHEGAHPHVGALDVVPVVYLDASQRGPACAEALTTAALIGEDLDIPVLLYGELATRDEHRKRSELRRGGPEGLARRIERGELLPDFGPSRAHEGGGAVLVAARPPLIAFNVDLVTDDVELAREIAASLRESGGGFPGVRAIGLFLRARGRAQVSLNVEDHRAVPLAEIVERVRAQTEIAEVELVGLAPRAAFDGFPDDVPLRGFDPERHLIENALR